MVANVQKNFCRYLSRELLQDDMRSLRKADIFSLGATIYELVCVAYCKFGC